MGPGPRRRPVIEGGPAFEVLREPAVRPAPFVSVIMRTQGRRMEAMVGALDSLAAQTDDDFELVVVAHNAEPSALEAVRLLLDQRGDLKDRTSLLAVEGGSRSRPLNAGFLYARGDYVLIFDDDDLLGPRWMGSTRSAARENPGKVIYSYVQTQQWEQVPAGEGWTVRPISAPADTYCRPFTMIDLLRSNYCPTLGLAYPREALVGAGLRFDEAMDVNEDWDYLLQAVMECGIAINPEATSVYRFWRQGENSHSIHDGSCWQECQQRLRQKLDRCELRLPPGSASHLVKDGRPLGLRPADPKLYIDTGRGFGEAEVAVNPLVEHDGDFDEAVFADLERFGVMGGFRFDPADFGFITVEGLRVVVELADGRRIEGLSPVLTNGVALGGGDYAFPKSDPQLTYWLPEPASVRSLQMKFRLRNGITDETLDRMFSIIGAVEEPPAKGRRFFGRPRS